jgi:hypothetical protein
LLLHGGSVAVEPATVAGSLEKGRSNLPSGSSRTAVAGATRQASVTPQRSSSALTCSRLTGPSEVTRPSTMRTLHTPQPPFTQPAGMPLRPSLSMPRSRLSFVAQG